MNKYIKKYNVILDNMDLNEYRLRPISAIMYIQDAFARYCATKKMAAYDLFDSMQYWIVTEFNIDFTDNLPFWSEEIEVEIWISELSKLKIYTDFNLYYNGKIFSKGNALWFIIDKNTKKPVKTDVVAQRFEVCPEYTLGEHKKFNLADITEKYNEIAHINNLSDLDFNKHVNNKSYINLAEMTAPDEFKKNYAIKKLNVRFNKETFLHDKLICATYKTSSPRIYIHKIEKEGASICDISTQWEERKNSVKIENYNLKIKG